jgi:hypothetical protein
MSEAVIELEGMGKQRIDNMAAGVEETAYVQLDSALHADDFALHGMHQTMEQRPVGYLLKHLDLLEAHHVHVLQIRSSIEAARFKFSNDRRIFDQLAPTHDDARFLENAGWKKGTQDSLLSAERGEDNGR